MWLKPTNKILSEKGTILSTIEDPVKLVSSLRLLEGLDGVTADHLVSQIYLQSSIQRFVPCIKVQLKLEESHREY